jgi:hypothetical protein
MRKTRSNALWNQLSAEQRETLDGWLFEEKLGYVKALVRAKAELGFQGKLSSLKRYYERRQKERTVMEFVDLRKQAVDILGALGDASAYRTAAMKLLTGYLLQQVRTAPGEVDKWGAVAQLIVNNDHNEAMRELKGDEHQIRRDTLDFARERFQFDMIERAVRALPELQKLAAAMNDADPKRYSDNPHWDEAWEKMFSGGMENVQRPTSKAGQGGNGAEGKTPNTKHQTPEKIQTPIQMTNDLASHDPSEWAAGNGDEATSEGETSNFKLQTPEKLQTPNIKEMTNDEAIMTKECRMTKDQVNEPIAELGKHPTSNIEQPTPNEMTKEAKEVGCPLPVAGGDLPKADGGAVGAVKAAEVVERAAEPPPVKLKFTENGTSHDGTFRIVGRDKTG